MKHALLLAAMSIVALGCSSSPKPTAEPGPAKTSEASEAPDMGAGIAWADKSNDQRKAFMKHKVVPAVAAIWKDSPEAGEEVTCKTCHGEGAASGDFEMPNDDLPKLDPSNQFKAHHDKMDWLKFMGKKLVPTMVKTLGVEPYNMETGKGFGCFACHGMKKPAGDAAPAAAAPAAAPSK